MQVRALQVCFVMGSLRKIGDEFHVADDAVLQTKDKPPVMERVGAESVMGQLPDEPAPPAKRGGRPKKKVDDPAEE